MSKLALALKGNNIDDSTDAENQGRGNSDSHKEVDILDHKKNQTGPAPSVRKSNVLAPTKTSKFSYDRSNFVHECNYFLFFLDQSKLPAGAPAGLSLFARDESATSSKHQDGNAQLYFFSFLISF